MVVLYSKEVLTKENELLSYRGEGCRDHLLKSCKKFYKFFQMFLNKKLIFTEEDLTKYWSEKTCHTCGGEVIKGDKNCCQGPLTL